MATGLKIVGDAGQVQIDETYANMCLLQKGTLACTLTSQSVRYVELTVTGKTPMIAWSSSFPVVCGIATRSGSSTTFRLFCAPANAGVSFTYYVFDWPLGTPGTYGLKVRNAAGELTFDSGAKYTRVVAVVNGGNANTSGSYASLPTGRTYAVMQSASSFSGTFSQLGSPDPQGNVTWIVDTYDQAAATTTTGMTWAPVKYYNGQQITAQALPPLQWPSASPGLWLMLDVTGY